MTTPGEAAIGTDPVWARRTPSGWTLRIRVQPGAPRTAVVGPLGDQLKIRVAAPPNEGRANDELLRFLAEALRVTRRDLRIKQGQNGRSKVIEVRAGVALPPEWL